MGECDHEYEISRLEREKNDLERSLASERSARKSGFSETNTSLGELSEEVGALRRRIEVLEAKAGIAL